MVSYKLIPTCVFFHPGLKYLQHIKVTLELCEMNARFDFHSVLNHYMTRYLQMSQSFKPFSCTYKTIRIQNMNVWTPVSRLLISTVTVPTAKSNMLTHSNLERCGWSAGNMLARLLLLFCKAVSLRCCIVLPHSVISMSRDCDSVFLPQSYCTGAPPPTATATNLF